MFLKKFLSWLPLAIVITAMSGLIYLAVQQELRLSANDPQIEMAEDGATNLSLGQSVETVFAQKIINISSSLAPFMVVYSSTGQILGSTGLLNGQNPKLPDGVLNQVKLNGQQRFTWQPQDDVRIAAVVSPVIGSPGGYVLVGRNLREVEKREALLEFQVGIVWLTTLFLTLAVIVLKDSKHFK